MPPAPTAGKAGTAQFQIAVATDLEYQQQLDDAREGNALLIVELHSSWCGPCASLKPSLQRVYFAEHPGVPLIFLTADMDMILQSVRAKTISIALGKSRVDDSHQSRWLPLLKDFQGSVEPIILFYRLGKLCDIVEGADLPRVLYNIERCAATHFDGGSVTGPGMTQKEKHRMAFMIQAKWRRRQQYRRMGVFIDGIFYTHSEVRMQREAELQRKREEQHRAYQNKCATKIQAAYRGRLVRKWYKQNYKALKQRKSFWMAALSRKKRAGGKPTVDKYDVYNLKNKGFKIATQQSVAGGGAVAARKGSQHNSSTHTTPRSGGERRPSKAEGKQTSPRPHSQTTGPSQTTPAADASSSLPTNAAAASAPEQQPSPSHQSHAEQSLPTVAVVGEGGEGTPDVAISVAVPELVTTEEPTNENAHEVTLEDLRVPMHSSVAEAEAAAESLEGTGLSEVKAPGSEEGPQVVTETTDGNTQEEATQGEPQPNEEVSSFGGLVSAIVGGKIDVVKQYLAAGGDINARDAAGRTALHVAAEHNQTDITAYLLDSGIDHSAKDNKGQPAIFIAQEFGNLDVTRLMLERGVNY